MNRDFVKRLTRSFLRFILRFIPGYSDYFSDSFRDRYRSSANPFFARDCKAVYTRQWPEEIPA